ncbi:MAG: hemerythrin domain-containing protein [Flavobacterium sp.]|nr:hemerythrin domain-containing protein [Pedobacter sp.]
MKRDINLQQLSRDHHHGLLLGWKIRQGLKYLVDPAMIVKYILHFSEEALFPHFEEENLILNYLSDNNTLKQQTLTEHENLKEYIYELSKNSEPGPPELLKIAEYLDAHIRFEERVLFPFLEKELSAEQLKEMGAAIDTTHTPYVETFEFEFWNGHVNQ